MVEDEPAIREMVESAFNSAGFATALAGDASEADAAILMRRTPGPGTKRQRDVRGRGVHHPEFRPPTQICTPRTNPVISTAASPNAEYRNPVPCSGATFE